MEPNKIIKKLNWCFKIKDGSQIEDPNERLSKSYLEESKSSLARAEKDFLDSDLLWATVVIYYAEYYALYSFLQRIGIKCENHYCSILIVTYLLGEEKTKIINEHKEKRIDAQYYMKTGKEDQVEKMLQEAKEFVSVFDEIISNLNEHEINFYRDKITKTMK
ncbi:MAG: HEPN domain-containing protein [Candidatus Aenigmarchaeota archaeon]|nr:HEPN domain-containing protein [Candidatus Aenigmarchaeota archaeon]MDI6722314.1 HEPN domain-containing protein [Candidatus Aenigmarchaeota archaeon]